MSNHTLLNKDDPSSPAHYNASETAVVLLDYHSQFLQLAPTAAAAVQIGSNLRDWAKSKNITVVHCLVDVDSTPHDTCKDLKRLQGFLNMMRSGGAEEPDLLLHDSNDLDKNFKRNCGYASALRSHGLHEFLQEKGIKSLIFAGISTSGCVLRTTNAATDLEYVVTVIADGCADRDQSVHDILVEKVLPSRAHVANFADFRDGYDKL
jgi:nicotinamidase-related amidase